MTKQPEGLIQILLDSEAEYGDRDDAAMDLGSFEGEAVEQALASIACDINATEGLADSCGESLAEIWCRRKSVNENVLVRLVPVSLRTALGTLHSCSPALAAEAGRIVLSRG